MNPLKRYLLENLRLYIVFAIFSLLAAQSARASDYFRIKVVDEQTERGIPMVELTTVNHLRWITDSAGMIAFYEPGLMNQRVHFTVRSHGYEHAKDGFGYRGTVLNAKGGGGAEIKLKRLNIAERICRLTGEGIYRDSVLLGEPVPLKLPLLNAQVLGQDSVLAAPYRGKIYWFWGDTSRARYPLGHFGTAGAVSGIPGKDGLPPSQGVDFEYFVNQEGFSRPMWQLEEKGMVWTDGLTVIPDSSGRERLVAHYSRMKDLGTRLEHGMGLFDDKRNLFERIVRLDLTESWRNPRGHPLRARDGSIDWIYFSHPFAATRVRADLKSVSRPDSYEALTCLETADRFDSKTARIRRNDDGVAQFYWTNDAPPIDQKQEQALVKAGKLRLEEARYQVRDVESEKPVLIHGGSIAFNEYRKKWILIGLQSFGSSMLGEVWYAEADSLTGPWRKARKIVTHEKYSFYNPVHHLFMDEEGGRFIYFEGTYSHTFSGNPHPTPRYDYNQMLYRLDLSDPRLQMAGGSND